MIITSMTVFALFYLGPKSPAESLCQRQQRCTPEKLARLEKAMQLDKPVHVAYGAVGQGPRRRPHGRATRPPRPTTARAPCLGISYSNDREVTGELAEKYPATLSLALGGSFIYLTLGVFIGVLAARYRGTFADRALVTSTLVVSAIPYYLVALVSWIFLTQKYPIFPQTDLQPVLRQPDHVGRRTAAALAGPRAHQRDGVLAVHAWADGRDPR